MLCLREEDRRWSRSGRALQSLKQPGDFIQDPILGLSAWPATISYCEKSNAFVVAANRKSHAFTQPID